MKMDMATAEKENKYDKYAVECAAKTLMEAEEIKKDPKMMALVGKELDKKKAHIGSIQDLRDKAAEMDSEDSKDDKEDSEEESEDKE